MASIIIRDIDEKLKAKLRIQAARHGRSIEDEARDILRAALSVEPSRTKGW
jgi:antitoxin FitA